MSERSGHAWCYGDNIDTDLITPGRYLRLSLEEAAKHVLEGVDPGFSTGVQPGDYVVAGRNFGAGSSRELAAQSLKMAGVSAVIAVSFARIFFRNAINVGLPVLECGDAGRISKGDALAVDLEAGTIRNLTCGETYRFPPLDGLIGEMLHQGGLVSYLEAGIRSGRIRVARPPDDQGR